MPIQLNEPNGTNLLVVHASGKLTKEDYLYLTPEIERLVQQHGKVRLLFEMIDFHGWDVGAAWEDLKIGLDHFNDIERMALVGEKKWQQGMVAFVKPFTKAEVRYFERAEAATARRWVEGNQVQSKAGTTEPVHHGR